VRKWLPLLTGLTLFVVAVLATIVWVLLTDAAGSERGLVIQNLREEPLMLRVDGESAQRFEPGEVGTIIVDKDDYPRTFAGRSDSGEILFEQEVEYADLSESDFRVAITEQGIAFRREPGSTPTSETIR
jgi:hypothetical protein